MATFFTADLHFGHGKIIEFCDRPFNDVSEMNQTLIKNWNNKVSNGDHVYIAGDLFYGGRDAAGAKEALEIVKKLNGTLHLISGNHDLPYLKNMDYHYLFADVDKMRYLKHEGNEIILCHYPMAEWSGYFRGSWHIYGHIHNAKNPPYDYMKTNEKALNAGVDICNFEPVTFDELIKCNRDFNK